MKTILHTLIVCFLLAGFVNTTFAQDDAPAVYLVLDYMKSTSPDYVQLEREVWKPIHEERMKTGGQLGWSLYSVPYPVGDDYTHVTVNVFPNLAAIDTAYGASFQTYFKNAHPDADMDAVMEKTEASREIVKHELWSSVPSASLPQGDGRYLTVHYMKVAPGQGDDYVALERDVWKPIQQAVHDAGYLDSWGVYQLWLPGGTHLPYNWAAVNVYDEFAQLSGPPNWNELVSSAHPDKEWSEIGAATQAAREGVRTEMWYLAVQAEAGE